MESVIAEFGSKEGEEPNPLIQPQTGQEPPSLEEIRTAEFRKIEELRKKEGRTPEEDEILQQMETFLELTDPNAKPRPALSDAEIDEQMRDLREKIENLKKPPEER